MIDKNFVLNEFGLNSDIVKEKYKYETLNCGIFGQFTGKLIYPPDARGKKIIQAIKKYDEKQIRKSNKIVKNLKNDSKNAMIKNNIVDFISLTPNKIYVTATAKEISTIVSGMATTTKSMMYVGVKKLTINGRECIISNSNSSKEKLIDSLKNNYCKTITVFYLNPRKNKIFKKCFA